MMRSCVNSLLTMALLLPARSVHCSLANSFIICFLVLVADRNYIVGYAGFKWCQQRVWICCFQIRGWCCSRCKLCLVRVFWNAELIWQIYKIISLLNTLVAHGNERQNGWKQAPLCSSCTAERRQEGKATGKYVLGHKFTAWQCFILVMLLHAFL